MGGSSCREFEARSRVLGGMESEPLCEDAEVSRGGEG